jgi:hypothetical protein
MKSVAKVAVGVILTSGLVGGGYVAGAAFQPPEIRTVTHTREVEVPGPVQWKTKRVPFVPQSCRRAIQTGNDMADLLDDYGIEIVSDYDDLVVDLESLVVDTYNMVDDAYNAGLAVDGFAPISNNLDQIEDRRDALGEELETVRSYDDELWQEWEGMPWFTPADSCAAAE